ncbi:MAG TPA: polysaccharide biosynthesis C-terminal domain-containing protein [Firmicutes bacterium]|nr:polysaccharide biosynthesis C-terminal domain-containing protein [Bacillota bacterium]
MIQTRDMKLFFKYVFPSILSFALSGVYAIVDGFFVGNSLGDVGLSAVNIAYPIVAFIQAVGTGIGMGGAIYYSINKAEKKEKEARMFTAGANWLMIAFSVILTVAVLCWCNPLLRLLGASGKMLSLAEEYIVVVTFGTILQVFGTGLVPLIRNLGGSFYAMIAMMAGFISNIILDYLFVWVWEQGVAGAAIATVIGQGVTMLIALAYIIQKKQFTLKIPFSKISKVSMSVLKIGIAPFGLAMSPNISLIIINRFSASYGGESAIAVYACMAYMICIIYLIFQGVGDGSQLLISRCYGEGDFARLKNIRRLAYAFAMLLLMLLLPPLFGGQVMIWWSTVIARILSAILALLLKSHVDRRDLSNILSKGTEK